MGVISTTILVIGGIGVLAAIVLYFVAKKFYVYENPKIAVIEELLPGAMRLPKRVRRPTA